MKSSCESLVPEYALTAAHLMVFHDMTRIENRCRQMLKKHL
jgi:hypothetical protein